MMDREFIHVDTETIMRNRDRLQALKTNDYRSVSFTKCLE